MGQALHGSAPLRPLACRILAFRPALAWRNRQHVVRMFGRLLLCKAISGISARWSGAVMCPALPSRRHDRWPRWKSANRFVIIFTRSSSCILGRCELLGVSCLGPTGPPSHHYHPRNLEPNRLSLMSCRLYGYRRAGVRQVPPCASSARAIRAVLLASATLTSRAGRRSRSAQRWDIS